MGQHVAVPHPHHIGGVGTRAQELATSKGWASTSMADMLKPWKNSLVTFYLVGTGGSRASVASTAIFSGQSPSSW